MKTRNNLKILVTRFGFALLLSLGVMACKPTTDPATGGATDSPPPGLSSAKALTAFKFLASDNSALTNDVLALIDENNRAITANLPPGTDRSALVTTLAGSATSGFADGTGTAAKFNFPRGITNNGTALYIADQYNHRIRKLTK